METPTYPSGALKAKLSATMSLAATLTSEGKITGVRVEESNVETGEKGGLLVSAALHNLLLWQFEPGKGQTMTRITYSYAIGNALQHSQTDVRFDCRIGS